MPQQKEYPRTRCRHVIGNLKSERILDKTPAEYKVLISS
jgi:hypothetical protein